MSIFIPRILSRQACPLAMRSLAMRSASNFTMTQAHSNTLNKEFWDKNKQLNRPLSPHLSVYKPQLTSTLSILHRATGLGASVVLYSAGIGALFCTSTTFPEIIQLIQNNVPAFLLLGTKAALGGSFIYHTLNGMRHLVWDVGYGFKLKDLYMSGYVVVVLTAIGTALIFIKG